MTKKQQALTIPEMKSRIEVIDGLLNLMRESIPAGAQKLADDMTIDNIDVVINMLNQTRGFLLERKDLSMRLELAELKQKMPR